VLAERADGQARLIELIRLLEAHRGAGSALAERLLGDADLAATFWLVEPVPVAAPVVEATTTSTPAVDDASFSQPDRNPTVAKSPPTLERGVPTL
jgi:hypothetical protein